MFRIRRQWNTPPQPSVGHCPRWKRAVALDPREFDTLFNLGLLLRQEGRVDEARGFLERFVAEAPPVRYGDDIARIRAWLGTLPG